MSFKGFLGAKSSRQKSNRRKSSEDQSTKLSKLFDKYADEDEKDETSDEGLMQFYKDAGINIAGRESLFVAHILESENMGEFTRDEFVNGFKALRCHTLDDIKKACSKECRNIATDESRFTKFYDWLFNFVKENEDKKSIPMALGMQLWTLVLVEKDYPLAPDFLKFCEKQKETESLSRDTWQNVRKFLKTCKKKDGFENDGAWPVLIDEFLDA